MPTTEIPPPGSPGIEVGDTVYVGAGKIHWIVEQLKPPRLGRVRVVLRSGMTRRRAHAWLDELTLHSKGKIDGQDD